MNVLLLDADKEERAMLKENLSKKGFAVTEGEGGLDMLEDTSKFKKDLILLEYNTWRANRGVYRYFGVEKMWTGVPVILISQKKKFDVFADRHPIEKDMVIEKPINITELDAALKPYIS